MSLPSFETVNEALAVLQADRRNPAELQGSLCGLLVTGAQIHSKAWVNAMLSEFVERSSETKAAMMTLETIFVSTHSMLQSDEFELVLLLPDDEAPLYERIQAVASFAQGFLAALNLVMPIPGLQENNLESSMPKISHASLPISEEAQEALDYLKKIAYLDYTEEDEADDAAEADYAEVCEFLKLAVILFHTQLKLKRHS